MIAMEKKGAYGIRASRLGAGRGSKTAARHLAAMEFLRERTPMIAMETKGAWGIRASRLGLRFSFTVVFVSLVATRHAVAIVMAIVIYNH